MTISSILSSTLSQTACKTGGLAVKRLLTIVGYTMSESGQFGWSSTRTRSQPFRWFTRKPSSNVWLPIGARRPLGLHSPIVSECPPTSWPDFALVEQDDVAGCPLLPDDHRAPIGRPRHPANQCIVRKLEHLPNRAMWFQLGDPQRRRRCTRYSRCRDGAPVRRPCQKPVHERQSLSDVPSHRLSGSGREPDERSRLLTRAGVCARLSSSGQMHPEPNLGMIHRLYVLQSRKVTE